MPFDLSFSSCLSIDRTHVGFVVVCFVFSFFKIGYHHQRHCSVILLSNLVKVTECAWQGVGFLEGKGLAFLDVYRDV